MGRRKRKEIVTDPASVAELHLDLQDYHLSKVRKSSPRPKRKWNPKIVDDWPEMVPIFQWELEFYELHFGDVLDEIFGIRRRYSDPLRK
jgi:hypothetical protein